MLRFLPVAVVLCALNIGLVARPVHAAPTPGQAHLVRVMIRLAGPPVAADPNLKTIDARTHGHFRIDPFLASALSYGRAIDAYQAKQLRYIAAAGVTIHVIRHFSLLFNGFAAFVSARQLEKLRSLHNVASVLPERMNVLMDDRSLKLIHTQQAWSVVGGSAVAGRGTYIAIVDTGIDQKNPCFSDATIPAPPSNHPLSADQGLNREFINNKVIVARAFGSFPGKGYSAEDTQGHGTFVAAVAACDYNTPTPQGIKISGVAPDAYLLSYNVYPPGDNGQGPEDAAIAAFTAAAQDGADVINFSSGFPQGAGDESEDAEVAAINVVARAGINIVVSAGNAGPSPLTISSPSTADSAIAVGASTNDRLLSETVHVNGPGTVPDSLARITAVQGDHPFTSVVGSAPVVYAGYGRVPGNSTDSPKANDFTGLDLHGKIALIERGDAVKFEDKINNAAHAGAIGVVTYDNQSEVDYPVMSMGTARLPAMLINKVDGEALLAWLKAHPETTLTMDPQKSFKSETPNIVSDFSSRGYGPNYRIKPDLVAPGQFIYSAAQTAKTSGDLYDSSGFAGADGTSFSSPHVAGAVALLLQHHPTWTPAQIKAALMETASTDSLTDPANPTPSVMEVGAGLLDVQAAVAATAYVSPFSASAGQANVGYGAQSQNITLTLHDAVGGSGSWSAHVQELHSGAGLTVSVPASVSLPSGGQINLALHLSEATSTKPGDYDGFVVLQQGAQTLHLPYFVHVAAQAVTASSVLLVDASTTEFQPAAPTAPIQHLDVSRYYEQALQSLKKPFTYWNEAIQGAPSLDDMKRASTVIYFTGNNLNFFAQQNSNPQALEGPLNTIDLSSLHAYVYGGGRLFISGMGAALSDPTWDAFVLGAQSSGLSEYDNLRNDKTQLAGIAPPQPSAVIDTRQFGRQNRWIFAGFKGVDFSPKGDGAGDNVAVKNQALTQLVGVTDLDPFTAKDPNYGAAYGEAALRTTDLAHAGGAGDVAIVNSDDPTLKHTASQKGRTVLFSFGFEGINNNTGYATREQVLRRIFQWFNDTPAAKVVPTGYRSGASVQLRATLKAGSGAKAVQYLWQVGSRVLKPTASPTAYVFPHAGAYRVRVQITDHLGHTAVSGWTALTVR